MSISPELGDIFRKYFQEHATPETEEMITKLASSALELTPLSEFNPYGMGNRSVSIISNSNEIGFFHDFLKLFGRLIFQNESDTLENNDSGSVFTAKRRKLAFLLKTGDIDAINEIVNVRSLARRFAFSDLIEIKLFVYHGRTWNRSDSIFHWQFAPN